METTATIRLTPGLAEKSAARDGRRGYSAIVDAVFADCPPSGPRSRIPQTAYRVPRACSSPPKVSRTRIGARQQPRPRRFSDADAIGTAARKQEEFDPGRIAWSKVDASGTPGGNAPARRGECSGSDDRRHAVPRRCCPAMRQPVAFDAGPDA